MLTAEERRRAREAYLLELNGQKAKITTNTGNIENAPVHIQAPGDVLRERAYEEKRRIFLSKQSSNLGDIEANSDARKSISAVANTAKIQNSDIHLFSSHLPVIIEGDIQNEARRALGQQIEAKYVKHPESIASSAGLAFGSDRVDEARRKREQQQEYNRALGQQLRYQQIHHNLEHSDSTIAAPLIGFGLDRDEELRRKREKQEEYTRGLDQQLKLKQLQREQHHQLDAKYSYGKVSSKDENFEAFVLRNKPKGYSNDERGDHFNDRKVNAGESMFPSVPASAIAEFYSGIGGENNVKEDKKNKQAEYAEFLSKQLLQKKVQEDVDKRTKREDAWVASPPINLAGEDAVKWVIGPLGVPVRRTVEVGSRAVQRLINQGQSSPGKTSPVKYSQQGMQPIYFTCFNYFLNLMF